jgi:hypothetical protein
MPRFFAMFLAMRSSLRWLLAVSVLLSAVAWWWPDKVSEALTHAGSTEETSGVGAAPALPNAAAMADAAGGALPEHLAMPGFDKAGFDPFVGLQPPAPPPPKPVAEPVQVPVPAPPQAPALNYRYLGQMTDPSGQKLHYLANASKDVPISVGTRLDEGYVVDAISADAVHLRYPPLDVRVDIRIPPADESPASP